MMETYEPLSDDDDRKEVRDLMFLSAILFSLSNNSPANLKFSQKCSIMDLSNFPVWIASSSKI